MCGIAGAVDLSGSSAESLRAAVSRMADALRHRGPDDNGTWIDAERGIAFGHRRLAIVDLSREGRQPMRCASGRYVITFNGEIYNHQALRHALEQENAAPAWRGRSDTEVALAAIAKWGLQGALERFVGMFALALWDRKTERLYLARDRLGEKPLYYGWMGQTFLFASELKALCAHPHWRGQVDRQALAQFLELGYIPTPRSIYRSIHKLPAASVLCLSRRELAPTTALDPQPYWSLRQAIEQGQREPFHAGKQEAIERLEGLLRHSVQQQVVADVPVGAFLSGGVDSATIVALAQAQSRHAVRTFSIGFADAAYDESMRAKTLARHLGTVHTELRLTTADASAAVPILASLCDEPFADPSLIPTYLVSKLARDGVTVSLSGDGGDELFAGYRRYGWARRIAVASNVAPVRVRDALAAIVNLTARGADRWEVKFAPGAMRQRDPGAKLRKLARALQARSRAELARSLASHGDAAQMLLSEPMAPALDWQVGAWLSDTVAGMCYADSVRYLPDDILVKLDRASMAVSLEARAPFLDHRVVEFAWQLPFALKRRGGQGKWILRQVLQRYVPAHLIQRPKTGFDVPLAAWLRTGLRDWAEHLLDEARLRREGYFNPRVVRQRWDAHREGRADHAALLWAVLMFQTWLETNARSSSVPAHASQAGAWHYQEAG